jgi:hypothetical protein
MAKRPFRFAITRAKFRAALSALKEFFRYCVGFRTPASQAYPRGVTAGMEVTVINQSATATGPNVFPATGETINSLAANTALAVAPSSVLIFFCGVAGSWWSQ